MMGFLTLSSVQIVLYLYIRMSARFYDTTYFPITTVNVNSRTRSSSLRTIDDSRLPIRPCVSMVNKTFLPAKSKQGTVLKWMLRLWNLPSNGTIATWNLVDVIRRSLETFYLQRFDILNENRNLWCRVFMSRLLIRCGQRVIKRVIILVFFFFTAIVKIYGCNILYKFISLRTVHTCV